MPKIKLKSNLHGVEIGIGNAIKLNITAGETVEVAEEILADLLALGHFELAKDEKGKQKISDPGQIAEGISE